MNILIIENESSMALTLSEILATLSHRVVATAATSLEALHHIHDYPIDICLINTDIEKHLDGIKTARLLREHYNIPALFVTSRNDRNTLKKAMAALPLGYLIMPLEKEEIDAALMVAYSHLKKKSIDDPLSDEIHQSGIFEYHTKNHMLTRNGTPIALTRRENMCLRYMFENTDRNISREQLIFSIWGGKEKDLSSLRELVWRIRKKLPELALECIHTYGYILHSEPTEKRLKQDKTQTKEKHALANLNETGRNNHKTLNKDNL